LAKPASTSAKPKDVGDVRHLEGRFIEIHGPVKPYGGRAEIILNRVGQLTGGSTLIPPMPKNYDVEKQGITAPAAWVPPKSLQKLRVRPTLPQPTATKQM
jgi:hypothetical protein